MPFETNSLEEHWMPFSGNRDFKANPRLVVKSEGMYCWDYKGGKLIDGSSGLFCCPAGHGRREIADAVHAQMIENDYTPHFQLGHPGSFELAERVARILPEPMNHVFFTNSGSESVDTAMKIALAYHRARGDGQRTRFVSRERAYHGVNMGGVSLAGMVKNRETFNLTLPNISHIRHTYTDDHAFVKGQPETGADLADDLQRICENFGGSTVAAVFIEPVAGSTGTLVPPKGYLERIRKICDDEVREALKAAGMGEFLEQLSAGLETEVGARGLKLSGGEKQRIAIARVILKNPDILLLDEATSSLDISTERQVQKNLDDLASDRTTLVIAHRLSTIRHADLILVMRDGMIQESGDFEALIAKKGQFKSLWDLQQIANKKHTSDPTHHPTHAY